MLLFLVCLPHQEHTDARQFTITYYTFFIVYFDIGVEFYCPSNRET